MVRKLLSLLLTVALLQPPGVCVCHASVSGCAASAAHSHCECAPRVGEPDHCCGDLDRTSEHYLSLSSGPDAGSSPLPLADDHAPGCPAGQAVGRYWTVASSSSVAPITPSFDPLTSTPAAAVTSGVLNAPPSLQTADQPRYLALRVLRI